MIPIRCFSCNKPVSKYYLEFLDYKNSKKDLEKFFDDKKIERYCCRRMLTTQVDTYKIVKRDKVKVR